MEQEYQEGGVFYDLTQRVVESTGCRREEAARALKVCDNIVEAAISCLSDPWPISSKKPKESSAAINASHEDDEVPGADLTPPDSECGDAPELDYRQGDPQLYVNPSTNSSQAGEASPQKPSNQQGVELPTLRLAELGRSTSSLPPRRQLSPLPGTYVPLTVTTSLTSLPRLGPAGGKKPFRYRESAGGRLSIERVCWALQTKQVSNARLQRYFAQIEGHQLTQNINKEVEGVPAIFYVVETNDDDIVRTWIEHGGDVDARRGAMKQPLLAFVIMLAERLTSDTTSIVVTLLAAGADPVVIPKQLYIPLLQDHNSSSSLASTSELSVPDSERQWCTKTTLPILAANLNLAQKYNLRKSATRKKPSARLQHAAAQLKISSLFGLPYRMVGQDIAVKQLFEELLGYLATKSDKPLVLFFCGPSGHGKSELSKVLGNLLSLPWLSIDMTRMKRETDLLGPQAPFHRYEEGSTLNNFISCHSGKRVVAVLDEFERSSHEVWDALLLPFGEGTFTDRRNDRPVDASKVIWILTSNALDPIIVNVLKTYNLNDPSNQDALSRELQTRLSKELQSHFGFPVAGRISSIVPFLPFSKEEQAVMAHRILLQLIKTVRAPVSVPENLVGNVNLRIRRDIEICRSLAEIGYHSDTGARSLESLITRKVKNPLVQKYLDGHDAINEKQPMEEYILDIDRNGQIIVIKGSE